MPTKTALPSWKDPGKIPTPLETEESRSGWKKYLQKTPLLARCLTVSIIGLSEQRKVKNLKNVHIVWASKSSSDGPLLKMTNAVP